MSAVVICAGCGWIGLDGALIASEFDPDLGCHHAYLCPQCDSDDVCDVFDVEDTLSPEERQRVEALQHRDGALAEERP